VHGRGAGFGGQPGQRLGRLASTDDQPAAQRPQIAIERRKAVMQPPTAGPAPNKAVVAPFLALGREDVDGYDVFRGQRGVECRVVGKAQILAEPDEDG